MLSDQGSNFLSQILLQIYINFAICYVLTFPYHTLRVTVNLKGSIQPPKRY